MIQKVVSWIKEKLLQMKSAFRLNAGKTQKNKQLHYITDGETVKEEIMKKYSVTVQYRTFLFDTWEDAATFIKSAIESYVPSASYEKLEVNVAIAQDKGAE